MRTLLVLVALVVNAVGLGSACGGTSSETPFPLEPDFARLDAGGPPKAAHYVVFTGEESADAAPPDEK